MKLRRHLVAAVAMVTALGVAAPAFAQGKGGAPPPDKRAQVEQRMKQVLHKVLRDRVGLDEKKATAVEKILEKNAKTERTLRQEQRKHRQELRALLKADSNDQAAYKRAITGLRASQKKLQAIHEQELDQVGRILTPKEQAKFLVAVTRMRQKLGQALGKYRQQHGGG